MVNTENPPSSGASPEVILFGIIVLIIYFIPTMVAYWRGHGYRHVIFGLNLIAGITVLGWIVAMIWSAWPTDKSLIDPVIGNVTGNGYRNAGDTVGAVTYGTGRGFQEERDNHRRLRRSENAGERGGDRHT